MTGQPKPRGQKITLGIVAAVILVLIGFVVLSGDDAAQEQPSSNPHAIDQPG